MDIILLFLDYQISLKTYKNFVLSFFFAVKILKDIVSNRFSLPKRIPLTPAHEAKQRASQKRYILGLGCKEYLKNDKSTRIVDLF